MRMHVLRKRHTWLAPRGTHAEYGERPQQPTGSYISIPISSLLERILEYLQAAE